MGIMNLHKIKPGFSCAGSGLSNASTTYFDLFHGDFGAACRRAFTQAALAGWGSTRGEGATSSPNKGSV